MKKRLLALFLCLLLLFLSSCSQGGGGFNYLLSDLTQYFKLDLSEITGGSYAIDIPDPYTEEDARREIRKIQLKEATCDQSVTENTDMYLSKPVFGNEVMIYFDVKDAEGQTIVSNLYTKTGAQNITIGEWEFPEMLGNNYNFIFHNKELSDALENTMPATRVAEGTVEAGDVVVVDFNRFNANGEVDESLYKVRIDTANLSDYEKFFPKVIADALVGKEFGKEYKVEDTDASVSYAFSIRHKMIETFDFLTVDIPEGTFDEGYSDRMQTLNGKTAYLSYTVAWYNNYVVPALDEHFYIDILGLKTTETDLQKIEQAAIRQLIYQKEQETLYNEICPQVSTVILDKLFETERVIKYPEKIVKAESNVLMKAVREAYDEAKATAEEEGTEFAYTTLDSYAADYYGYDPYLFATAEEFCMDEAKYQIKLRLAIFTMAQVAGIRYTLLEADSTFATYMEYQARTFTQQGVSLTEEEKALLVGAGALKGSARYAEYLQLAVKFYKTYQELDLTTSEVAAEFGTEHQLRFRAIFQMLQMDVMTYVYENNTWTDTTP